MEAIIQGGQLDESVLCSLKVKVPHTRLPSVVPKLIPVLGSQPAGDVSHKPGPTVPESSTLTNRLPSHPSL